MSFARDVLLIFKRQMRLSLRNPAWVIIGLTQPILYLAFFGPLFTRVFSRGLPGVPQTNSYGFFVPGLLVQLGLFGAAFVGFTIIADWRAGVIERMRVTPVSRLALLLGRVSRDVVVLFVQAVVLVLAGLVAGMRAPVGGVLIGLAFVARLTPFGYIINAMRDAFNGTYLTTVMAEGAGVAVGLAAVCLFLGARAFLRENAWVGGAAGGHGGSSPRAGGGAHR